MARASARSRNPAGHGGLIDNAIGFVSAIFAYIETRAALCVLPNLERVFGLNDVHAHRFFAVSIAAGLSNQLQNGSMLEIAGGDDHGIQILQRQHVVHVLKGAGCA